MTECHGLPEAAGMDHFPPPAAHQMLSLPTKVLYSISGFNSTVAHRAPCYRLVKYVVIIPSICFDSYSFLISYSSCNPPKGQKMQTSHIANCYIVTRVHAPMLITKAKGLLNATVVCQAAAAAAARCR